MFHKVAFDFDLFDYESHKLIKIEVLNKECRFCGILKWKEEAAGMCCLGEKVALLLIDEPVEPLKEFFSYEKYEFRHFLKKT